MSIISHIDTCKTTIGITPDDTPIKLPQVGERVGVVSMCRLLPGQNYVFAGDMRHGHVANQLVVGCAQRDIDYTLYFISRKLKCCSS